MKTMLAGVAALFATFGAAQAGWSEKVLIEFNGTSGANPAGALVANVAGVLYGTTTGGSVNDGTVFSLTPPAAGKSAWTEQVLFTFSGADGIYPYAGLIADAAGNLYGTTNSGGEYGHGTVFKLTPPVAGTTAWTHSVIWSFNGSNGNTPYAGLIADAAGNLYGTTYSGGASNDGTVFKLSPPAAGATVWTESILLSFKGTDGSNLNNSLGDFGLGVKVGRTRA